MTSDRLSDWLTLGANIGVLVGIVVLIYEVRQNTEAMRNETDVAIYSMGAEQANLVVDNATVAQLMVEAETSGLDALSAVDRRRLFILYSGLVDRLELQFRLYKRNNDDLDTASIVFPEEVLTIPAFGDWWDQNREIYHPDFVIFFDRLLQEAK